ncbi:ROK family protein, partial [Streptomyces sp. GbtcB7]|uniref:ROK family protein n=1 Tax=Streptomyces sp. GbtcB7 TaxID=2824752 RepID=UPI0034D494C4
MIDPSRQRVAPAGAQDLMPTWIGAPQRQRIARRVHAPTWFENDGRMGALGEARFGVGRQSQSLLFAAISAEGIGGGLIIEREVY